MEKPSIFEPMYLRQHKDKNAIGPNGCKYLSMGDWPQLQTLSLSKKTDYEVFNNVQEKGCKHLAKAKWPNLQQLYLCMDDVIELPQRLMPKHAKN